MNKISILNMMIWGKKLFWMKISKHLKFFLINVFKEIIRQIVNLNFSKNYIFDFWSIQWPVLWKLLPKSMAHNDRTYWYSFISFFYPLSLLLYLSVLINAFVAWTSLHSPVFPFYRMWRVKKFHYPVFLYSSYVDRWEA